MVNAVGHLHKYDDRFAHNPPKVEQPAMDDAQFWYDEQREIEANLLSNPQVMAHTVADLKLRVKELETWLRKK
jgi:hypothetical protein